MRIRLNHPFTLDSILDDLVDYRLNIFYDGTILTGYLTQEFDKNASKLRYVLVNEDAVFLELDTIRKIDILTP